MKVVALVSSGIDSPVATYLISKKAKEIILVHADNRPFTDDREIENFIILAKHLKKHLVEAVLIDFINFVGSSQGCDLGLNSENFGTNL
jgi:adenylyl- and sulfurtransferase ThiI